MQLVFDNVVEEPNGRLRIVESMFSSVCDLGGDPGEVAARIHPFKQQLFDAVLAGQALPAAIRAPYGELRVAGFSRDIALHVNSRRGGAAITSYAEVAGKLQQAVRAEVTVRGFDPGLDPVLRQMRDGTLRLVFCSMPPRAHRLGLAFDIDHFGDALVNGVQADITWDDRDVFHIPKATEEQVREILRFVLAYGQGE